MFSIHQRKLNLVETAILLISYICWSHAAFTDTIISHPIRQQRLSRQNDCLQSNSISWENIVDRCYLITCPSANGGKERFDRSMAVLNEVGLMKVNRDGKDFTFIKEFEVDEEDRIRGCYTSHINVLKEGFQALKKNRNGNTNNILVIEDNVAVTDGVDREEALRQIYAFLNSPSSASSTAIDVIHMSYIAYVPNLTVTKTNLSNIVKLNSGIGSSLGTTAYLISLDAIEALLKEDKEKGYYGAAIPDVMADLFAESRYSTYPVPFHRASNVKSLVNPQLDSLREILFEPTILLKVQAMLAETGLSTNTLLFLTIGLLVSLSTSSLRIAFDAFSQILRTGAYDGVIIFPLVCSCFGLFSLAIIAQGIALAPKQEEA